MGVRHADCRCKLGVGSGQLQGGCDMADCR